MLKNNLILLFMPLLLTYLFNLIIRSKITNIEFIMSITILIYLMILLIFKIIIFFLNNTSLPKIINNNNNNNIILYFLSYFFIFFCTELFGILLAKYFKISNYNEYLLILIEILYPFIHYYLNPSSFYNTPTSNDKDHLYFALKFGIFFMSLAKFSNTYYFDRYKNKKTLLIKYSIIIFLGAYMKGLGDKLIFKLSEYYPLI